MSLPSVDQVSAFCWDAAKKTISIAAVLLFTCCHFKAPEMSFRQVGSQIPDSNLSVAGRRDSLHPSLLPF